MKKSEVSEIVMMLMAAFPASKTSDGTSAVYEELLVDLDAATVQRAVTRLIATNKWLPTIAEIRASATDLRLGPARDGGEAWQDALCAVRRVGRYGVPRFADALVTEALRLWGSWVDFCNSPEDDPGGRARFIELYDSLAARRRDTDVSGIPLPAPKSSPVIAAPVRQVPPAELPRAPLPALARVPRAPDRPHRRYSADELDAALGGAEARA